jgi:hypothetical protein
MAMPAAQPPAWYFETVFARSESCKERELGGAGA